jgi:hypothetical protein
METNLRGKPTRGWSGHAWGIPYAMGWGRNFKKTWKFLSRPTVDGNDLFAQGKG